MPTCGFLVDAGQAFENGRWAIHRAVGGEQEHRRIACGVTPSAWLLDLPRAL
jgi:hypothetical protein